ncbi:MAG: KamA family radical SAM protein [Deltaproteobacteria bacterium]|nr:KamA family radical SAM protein [Deltaproteobacteria bacterium]
MEASSPPSSLNRLLNVVKTSPYKQQTGQISRLSGYTDKRFKIEADRFLNEVRYSSSLEEARSRLSDLTLKLRIENSMRDTEQRGRVIDRTRDCTRAMLGTLSARADEKTGFSVTQAFWDIAQDRPRPDLKPGFYAELIHFIWGIEARTTDKPIADSMLIDSNLNGRDAALARSKELDNLWGHMNRWMDRYSHGLTSDSRVRRTQRRKHILNVIGGTDTDWTDWKWQVANVGKDAKSLEGLITLSAEELDNIEKTCKNHIPFGVTPYYLSLMDDIASTRDRAVRAQVFPPTKYIDEMTSGREKRSVTFDFMQERNTSPIDLVTRRYPGIAILKPYNTCPQICVYCQRNWEIDEVLAKDALAPWEKIEDAVKWIGEHPAIHEVLITGGDPFLLEDKNLKRLLEMVSTLPAIRRIRLGTRTPVTLPMRITDELSAMLGQFRETGRREIDVVTHVEHPYEITPEMGAAVERLRLQGIPIYNQLVYTYFVSRRFEASLLRVLLRKVGIEPYYTFLPKGKSETSDYQVPLSRLLQEQIEETRLLPGLCRTDEAVYNVPKLGKNYLRASQCRDLLTILPNGTRVYEFHPWEENIAEQESYVGEVAPILSYLTRIEKAGDDVSDYESIWYYY